MVKTHLSNAFREFHAYVHTTHPQKCRPLYTQHKRAPVPYRQSESQIQWHRRKCNYHLFFSFLIIRTTLICRFFLEPLSYDLSRILFFDLTLSFEPSWSADHNNVPFRNHDYRHCHVTVRTTRSWINETVSGSDFPLAIRFSPPTKSHSFVPLTLDVPPFNALYHVSSRIIASLYYFPYFIFYFSRLSFSLDHLTCFALQRDFLFFLEMTRCEMKYYSVYFFLFPLLPSSYHMRCYQFRIEWDSSAIKIRGIIIKLKIKYR